VGASIQVGSNNARIVTREHPIAAGPPLKLRYWIRAAADNEFDDNFLDDNKAVLDSLGIMEG
jgi:hypothetical protein